MDIMDGWRTNAINRIQANLLKSEEQLKQDYLQALANNDKPLIKLLQVQLDKMYIDQQERRSNGSGYY